MDGYEVTTDGWAPFGYLDLIPLPKPLSSPQEDSGRTQRRFMADKNNNSPQLFPQSLTSLNEQPNHKRRRLVADNKNDSPQLFLQSLSFPNEQPNPKRPRSVVDHSNGCPQLFSNSLPSANEQPNRKHPQRISVHRDHNSIESQGLSLDEQKDGPETFFSGWLTTSRTTSAGEYISMLSSGHGL